jgi:hypothetical protein
VSRVGVTLSDQLSSNLLRAVGEVEARESALEHGQRGLGLVEGDFVAGFVDAEEADCWDLLVKYSFPQAVFRMRDNIQFPYCLTSPYSVPSTVKGSYPAAANCSEWV